MSKVSKGPDVPVDRVVETIPRIRSAYDGHRVAVRLICCDGEDRTQQSFREECDINVLMKRYEQTGVLPTFPERVPQYLDVTDIDFQSSMDRVASVQGVFSQLDARTRARFENNPELMLEFLADPANREEGEKLGLLPKGSGAVRGEAERVSGDAGSGAVRPGAERLDVSGGNAGGGASPVPAVEPAAGNGAATGPGGA